MKINITQRLDAEPNLIDLLKRIAYQVNLVSEGSLAGTYNASTAAPTTGTWAKGDFIRNSNPSELGSAGSKYVVKGWICVTGGTPGTWVQSRTLTGN